MIKINLLPARKPKREVSTGERHFAMGLAALAVAAGGTYFFVHRPKQQTLADVRTTTETLKSSIATKRNGLKGYDELKKVVEAAELRSQSIKELNAAVVIPAHILRELGEILSTRGPTMSEIMTKRVKDDPNRSFMTDWDPTHVWIDSFKDSQGEFTLTGGAQGDNDITQLAKRMQASVYFRNVVPTGAERATEPQSNVAYYKFTITGKLVY